MSNEVWVTWKDSTGTFVKQQNLTCSPGSLEVSETQGGEALKPSTQLSNYFVPPPDVAAEAPGPGRSEETALFITLPPGNYTLTGTYPPPAGRPPLPSNLNNDTRLERLLALQVPPRKATCRMWTGERTVYKLNATSFTVFDQEVKKKYPYLEEENFSYYYIKDKRDVNSRTYLSNDQELNDFFDLAGKPTIYIWPRGSPSLSPDSSPPSQVEIHLSSAESLSESSDSSSRRGHVQKLFRSAVRERDDFKCVLSGEVLRPKAGNLEAAHIIGVENSLADTRKVAGVLNPYDTANGMLLEKSLHVAFDSYLWCMDESLKVHVSEDGKNNGLEKWEGQSLMLRVSDGTNHTCPSRALLKARFNLYEEKEKERKEKKKAKKEKIEKG